MSARFPIGSVVRPLNETGEGVVSAYRRDGCILVSMQDGFEIPYMPNQLVLISAPKHSEAESAMQKEVRTVSASDRPEAFYFAFLAEGMKSGEAQIVMQLMNTGATDLLVQVYGLKGKLSQSLFAQRLEARKSQPLIRGNLGEMLQYDRFYVQLFPVMREGNTIPGPWEGYVKHQIPALADPSSWPQELSFSSRALVFQVFPEAHAKGAISVQKDVPQQGKSAAALRQENDLLISERDNYHEVDLHIEELLDDTRGMDNAAIIRFQLQHFQRCIDEARRRRLWKFTAIHGIGKGVLKSEVRRVIAEEGLKFQDASYARYGYGATEVLMR